MKRVLDLVLVVSTAAVWLPFLLVLALLVRLKVGSPAFFRQKRPGFQGQVFELIKFRTMTDAKDGMGKSLADRDRLTPFGRWLRSTSLDELPELINVLRGEMSLVGPRPLLIQYLDRYTPEQARRHEVRPGLTGWCQVNGRNALSWPEKFKLDVWYVDHQSIWLDLKILWLTVGHVVRREGISAPGEATMPEYMGSTKEKDVVRRLEAIVLAVHRRNGGCAESLDLNRSLWDREMLIDSLDLAEIMVAIEREFGVSPFNSPEPPRTWQDVSERVKADA